jgi:hypothetical protein
VDAQLLVAGRHRIFRVEDRRVDAEEVVCVGELAAGGVHRPAAVGATLGDEDALRATLGHHELRVTV